LIEPQGLIKSTEAGAADARVIRRGFPSGYAKVRLKRRTETDTQKGSPENPRTTH